MVGCTFCRLIECVRSSKIRDGDEIKSVTSVLLRKVILQPCSLARISARAAHIKASGEYLISDVGSDEAAASSDDDQAAKGNGKLFQFKDGHCQTHGL